MDDMPRVRLLHDVTAEGVTLPAGTVCVVERDYGDTLDLCDPQSGTLLWVRPQEVERD